MRSDTDTRLAQTLALLDDARCLLHEMAEEGHPKANHLNAAHLFVSSAIPYIQDCQ